MTVHLNVKVVLILEILIVWSVLVKTIFNLTPSLFFWFVRVSVLKDGLRHRMVIVSNVLKIVVSVPQIITCTEIILASRFVLKVL